MRQWRVGTLSMGISLIIMGVILFLSGANGREFTDMLLAWWPMIFILLGIEILLYLFVMKKENAIIKYDVFSIFFVGILGTVCLGFTVLTSIGLVDEVRGSLQSVEKTVDLPSLEEQIPDSVTRMVVQKGYKEIDIEKTKENEILFFGTYRTTVDTEGKKDLIQQDDLVSTKISGNTMYVTIKDLPEKKGLDYFYPQMTATLVVPEGIDLVLKPETP